MPMLDSKLNAIQQKAQARVDHYKGLILKQETLSGFHADGLQIANATLQLIKIIDRLRLERDEQMLSQNIHNVTILNDKDSQLEMELDK